MLAEGRTGGRRLRFGLPGAMLQHQFAPVNA